MHLNAPIREEKDFYFSLFKKAHLKLFGATMGLVQVTKMGMKNIYIVEPFLLPFFSQKK